MQLKRHKNRNQFNPLKPLALRDIFVIQVKILFSTYKFLSSSTFIGTLFHFLHIN